MPVIDDPHLIQYLNDVNDMLSDIRDTLLYDARRNEEPANPFNKYGRKIFSQTDEDGITLEIVKRLGITKGTFAEFGIGDGTENNTLVLVSMGWRGVWIDGSEPRVIVDTKPGAALGFFRQMITLKNVLSTTRQCQAYLGLDRLDLISMDFDSNDYHLVEELLKQFVTPSVFLVEYNGKLCPPIEWVADYDEQASWEYDDYFGASLASYHKLFDNYGYFPVCCNHFTGANAWFVRKEFQDRFPEVPKDLDKLWVEPRYYLPRKYGHRRSTKLAESIIKRANSV